MDGTKNKPLNLINHTNQINMPRKLGRTHTPADRSTYLRFMHAQIRIIAFRPLIVIIISNGGRRDSNGAGGISNRQPSLAVILICWNI